MRRVQNRTVGSPPWLRPRGFPVRLQSQNRDDQIYK